ncbi:glycosyltransferase family 4 protein [Candidatus Berkelbacteria bacterium]|nr:glycosyltransferase family 4 protein [Candidatus Berkelbacteria bacterium]
MKIQHNDFRPVLLIVSDVIRADLHQPLRHFKRFRVIHLYRRADVYADMSRADFSNPETIRWVGFADLWRSINAVSPNILQGAEPWATKASLVISFVTWWYHTLHPTVRLVWPALENRPIKDKFGFPLAWLMNRWVSIYGRGADLVMYRNKGTKRNLLAAGVPESKLKFVMWGTWGVDTQLFRPIKVKKPPFGVVLFVGKVSVAKGVPWLISAMDIIAKQFPNVELWVTGQRDPSFTLPRRRYLRFFGALKHREMPKLMNRATIVVAPSITTKIWEEQVGMVNLQALACETPLVTTNSGAIPEFVRAGEGAILVPEQNAAALADAILKLLVSPKKRLANFGRKGRAWVSARYQIGPNVEKIERLLKTI